MQTQIRNTAMQDDRFVLGYVPTVIDYRNKERRATARICKSSDGSWVLMLRAREGKSMSRKLRDRLHAETFLCNSATVRLWTGGGGYWEVTGYPATNDK